MMRLGLTGWPLAHSLSPRLQNAALHALGINGEYGLYPAEPSQPHALVDLINDIRAGKLQGLNVTIPHKQAVIPLLDDLTPSARAIGAVNTIYMENNMVIGHNTDAPGFIADLRDKLFNTDEAWNSASAGQALILGAGGSARAVVWALINAGWDVVVAARNLNQASALVEAMSETSLPDRAPQITMLDAGGLPDYLAKTCLIVNTTPLGMSPKTDFSPYPVGLQFPAQAVLYDLVYNPRETLLVKQARDAGLRAVNGLGMLVEQAALGFEIWTGCAAPRKTMYLAVEA
jgi:shikimate dehydrogenase